MVDVETWVAADDTNENDSVAVFHDDVLTMEVLLLLVHVENDAPRYLAQQPNCAV